MRIFLDTNILLDFFDDTRWSSEDSKRMMLACERKEHQVLISAMSVPNVLYVLRKAVRTHEEKNLIVRTLCGAYEIVPLERGDLLFATGENFCDYEDGLQCLAAEKMGADYIVTNDKEGFQGAKVKVVTPKEFLELVA